MAAVHPGEADSNRGLCSERVLTSRLYSSDVADIWKEGDRAGVKWVVSVCRNCEFCTNGTDELQCPKQLNSGTSI